ncbi:O-acetylhomoserine/O-acetylserine sulfhydrylase [Corynebacterium diphtheriae bv. mitis]|uniref:O-acetylhomoserine/O-acetylserine sulfhydrylase n=1 Tax=Corynebacterium diphtheriae TaxID=1717 RepID=UPI0013C919E9|nr:O-acetylhomoserine/O-acetylserine sulfhydrylase [Corynebacterium diphtheriae]MBG9246246.1 O-acetylhomoserine/O-acetylserine sulfhydrylase [Corynebacterium diphtheriae bv. mitis]UJM22363.1 O-acetylhomoserine/O-acetylserine sulfhydrylase [Corynebacterium diphtheriae]CAB0836555.1 O-acetylhomoserine aminocarboxypropyltransferase [Corynebacterium diphtheriae]CAB0896642.1 O-acetylhomoserine aminocarboxypropyltransferase [Corynebacterium diphtheriae]
MPTKYDNSNANKWGFETRSIHAGQSVDSDTSARNLPIYLTSSYVFNDAEHAANRFNLSDAGPVYSRLTNPTVAAVEERLANLEGGVHAVLFASGMAAETAAILNIARAGSHIVSSPRIYGGTETLFAVTLARLGIETTFVENPDDPASWEAAVQDNTVALYGETFANPQADVLDIPAIAEVAHKHQVPLIVDNTLATAALVRPLELGADVVVASLTKFYTGNGSGLGGVLIDGGNFDWTVTRNGEPIFPDFVTPDPAYHGLKYSDLGAPAFGLKARVGLLRDTGAAPSPLNAWITAQGLDTLSLRVQRHNENALAVAQFLANHEKVAKVNYAGLPDSPWYPVKEKLGFDYTGSVLSFDVKGGKNEAWRFIDALKLHSNLANVGDVRSLVVHPATTTHSQSEESALLAAGINQATIRLSVGIESIDDIIVDLTAGFDAI